jgi:hypothetical protein
LKLYKRQEKRSGKIGATAENGYSDEFGLRVEACLASCSLAEMTAVDHVALWLWKGSSVAAAGPAFACRFIPQFTIQALHRHSSNCATTTRSVAASDELHATSETTVGKPGSERSSMAEDEPSGTEAAPTSPAARTLKIPCLVTGVGYTFTVQVNDDFTVTRFREMAWRHLVQTINENPRLPVMTGENEDTTIQVEEYADVETRGCIRVCLGSVTPSNASHCWCPEERVQRVSSGLARFRACCCGQKRPCFSLYLAKGPTKGWLTEDSIFIKTLQCGRVPWTIKWLVLTTSNMIRLAENQTLADLDLPDYGGPGEICILVHNAPMDITAGLRVTVENDIRYYKMVHAQGLYNCRAQHVSLSIA